MEETLEIQLHFQCTVPVLKGKHGSPVQPECGIKHLIIKYIFNGLVVQVLISGHKELDNLHTRFLTEIEPAIGVGILSTVDGCPTK